MPPPLSPAQCLKRNSLYTLIIVIAVIGIAEALATLLLDALHQQAIALSPLQNTALNITLLTILSAPLLWFLALRPLALQTVRRQTQADEQIVSNKELLEALEAHVLVSISDVQGRIVYANDKFCKISGYTQEELIGQDHRIVNSGHHDKDYIRNMWRTIAGGQTWHGEFCNRSKNGSFYWVDSTIAPLLDEAGKPRLYISIRRNITTQKQNEVKLTALKRALDASSEMILITDAAGHIQYANPALCLFTGWTEDALMNRKPDVLDSPNVDQKTLAKMQNQLKHGKAWSGRLLGRRRGIVPIRIAGQATPPDTLEYWAKINVTPILTPDGALSGYVQIQHDVSDLVKRELALQTDNADTVARLAISEALHQPQAMKECFIRVLDILFDLKTFNLQRKGGVFLRVQDEDCLDMFVLHGEFSDEFIRKEQRIALGDCLCGRAAMSGKILVSDDCFCDPRHEHQFDGMQPHGHYIVPIASGGDILGVLFLYTDPYPMQSESRITMLQQVGVMMALALLQQRAKDSLEAARDTALQAAQTKSAFLANMSHEIRAPMSGVLGMLEIIKDTKLSREQEDMIEIAANSAESLLVILNDILDFSKLEAGKVKLEEIEFDLPDLVKEVCSLLSKRAHSKGLELGCFLPDNLPPRWRGDPMRIRQILTNLIGNAIKFTDQGAVSVKVFMSEVVAGVARLRFEVKDTGIGIAPETQTHLFQPFSQADSSTARRFGGTGLGLSISKNLVEIMGGIIGVESALGLGARFWFTLPLTPVENNIPAPLPSSGRKPAPAAKMEESLPDYSDRQVLVVEDDAINQTIIASQLAKFQIKPDVVNNGQLALDRLQHKFYDLVLMDCQMPVMDGYETTRILRGREIAAGNARRVSVVALTAHAATGEREKCLAAGMDDYLAKPVTRADLAKVLPHWLGEPCTRKAVSTPADSRRSKTSGAVAATSPAETFWDEAATLKQLDNDADLLAEMIGLFINEAPRQVAELHDAINRSDLAALADAAHAIKGMAEHFHAETTISLALKLEHAARNAERADFQLMTNDLSNAIMRMIENLLHREKTNP